MSEETRVLLANLYNQLRAPLPDEAIIDDNSRGFRLTGIKSAYVIERFNDVFGLCGTGWQFQIIRLEVADGWAFCQLNLFYCVDGAWSKAIPATGSKQVVKGREGDALKSAVSDALKKAGSYVGVGERAYKGLLTPPGGRGEPAPRPPAKAQHWIDDPVVRARFWAWAKGTLKLTEDQIYDALGVEKIHDFTGSMSDAKRILEEAAVGSDKT